MRRLVLLAALALAAPAAVHARAGGGDSYSSGSSGSSSGSSGSSGGSYSSGGSGSYDISTPSGSGGGGHGGSTWPLVLLLFAFPGAFALIAYAQYLEQEQRIRRAAQHPAPPVPRLQSADPLFSQYSFLPRVEDIFIRVQKAWSAGDMTPVCHLLSDGVFERFQLLLDLQRREGRINKIEGLSVGSRSIALSVPGERFDAVHVRIGASCVDTYLSAADGSLLKETKSVFVEYWSFLRSVSARGSSKPGLAEGVCPACGTALAVNASAVCPRCKAWVNSGEFDWVLAEITQESEWRDTGTPSSAQDLEDRASMLFWRWLRCLAYKDASALEGWCSEDGLEAVLASGVGKTHFEDCGVGSVEVRAPVVKNGLESVPVEVLWMGREGRMDAAPRRHKTVLTLSRKEGSSAPPNTALRSAHCAGCGAGIPAAKSSCEHCGRGFKDPAVDWVLTGLRVHDA